MSASLKAVAMASGGGRTVLNLLESIAHGTLRGVALDHVFVSRHEAPAVERCIAAGMHVHLPDGDVDASAKQFLLDTAPDLVLLCGYLRHLYIPTELANRVLNIHPSLLPAFGGQGMYGLRVHTAVLESKHTESGCTVHLVDHAYDSGPIVLQQRCPVHDDDTPELLASRVFELECAALPEAVGLAAQGRLRLIDGRIEIAPDTVPWPHALFRRL